jgi:two-component sensor histidine kinase
MATASATPAPIRAVIIGGAEGERLRQTFTRRGHEARAVSLDDGIAAVDAAVEVVVLNAPRRAALELCRRIKTRHQLPFLPVIVRLSRPARVPLDPTAPDAWLSPSSPPRDVVARAEELVRVRRAEEEPARLSRSLAELAAENGRLYDQARRDAEATTLLLRELQHRVRNNLAAIQALLVLERHRDPPRRLAEALDVAIARLRSMAATQDFLSAPTGVVEVAALARTVVRGARDVFDPGGAVQCEVRGEARLPARAGSGIAIVLNELITNALKHARATTLTVEIRQTDGEVRVAVADDGSGMPDEPVERSGLMISRAVVANELSGSLELLRPERGARVEIRVRA